MSRAERLFPVDDGLYRHLSAEPVKRKRVKLTGYRLIGQAKRTSGPTLLADEQVLECRALYEFSTWDALQLAARYGVSVPYMRHLLDYTVRSKLVAKREHLPEIAA